MKRLTIWFVTSLLLAVFASPLAGAASSDGLTGLTAQELTSITAGVCTNCAPEDEEPPPSKPPRVVNREWHITSSTAGNTSQISYTLLKDYANYASNKVTYQIAFDDGCSQRLTSGGIGISSALNISVGTTIHCNTRETVNITVSPKTRVKLYQGLFRTIISYVAHEYINYSDGSSERSGRTDRGSSEHRFYRLSTVENPL